jgi:hypothetical protein
MNQLAGVRRYLQFFASSISTSADTRQNMNMGTEFELKNWTGVCYNSAIYERFLMQSVQGVVVFLKFESYDL